MIYKRATNFGIIFVYFSLIVLSGGAIFLGIKVAQEIEERGLKEIIMEIWEGPEE